MSLLFRKLLKFWLLTKDLSDWLEEHISVGSLFQILLAREKYEFVIFVFFLTESVVLTAYWFIGFLSDLVGAAGLRIFAGRNLVPVWYFKMLFYLQYNNMCFPYIDLECKIFPQSDSPLADWREHVWRPRSVFTFTSSLQIAAALYLPVRISLGRPLYKGDLRIVLPLRFVQPAITFFRGRISKNGQHNL